MRFLIGIFIARGVDLAKVVQYVCLCVSMAVSVCIGMYVRMGMWVGMLACLCACGCVDVCVRGWVGRYSCVVWVWLFVCV